MFIVKGTSYTLYIDLVFYLFYCNMNKLQYLVVHNVKQKNIKLLIVQ